MDHSHPSVTAPEVTGAHKSSSRGSLKSESSDIDSDTKSLDFRCPSFSESEFRLFVRKASGLGGPVHPSSPTHASLDVATTSPSGADLDLPLVNTGPASRGSQKSESSDTDSYLAHFNSQEPSIAESGSWAFIQQPAGLDSPSFQSTPLNASTASPRLSASLSAAPLLAQAPAPRTEPVCALCKDCPCRAVATSTDSVAFTSDGKTRGR